MEARAAVLAAFEEVAQEQKRNLAPLADDLPLLDSGLDSLAFATVVARLEDRLGIDPFSTDEEVELPITLGDFIKCYEDAGE